MEVVEEKPQNVELECVVCRLLLLEPTTLNCGHTFCRGCLADWYLSSTPRRDICPICRQKWEGYPRVNTSMRNVIEQLEPELTAKRRQEMAENSSDLHGSNLEKFEKELKQKFEKSRAGESRQTAGFLAGICVAVFAMIVIYFFPLWGAGSHSSRGAAEIPVAKWKASDVAQWLNSLGWARNYSDAAQNHVVDGSALLHMETDELMERLNITDPYHRNAFGVTIASLIESGVRIPQTLWEYKELYPGRTMYLSHALKEFPRCAVLYLYLFDYEDSFLPFLHTTVPKEWEEELQYSQRLPEPSMGQRRMFFLMMLVFPYGMIGLFAWSLRSAHTLTHLLVIVSCFFQTIFELTFISNSLLHGQWRHWRQLVRAHCTKLQYMVMYLCLWPVLPSFVCSLCFYKNVYYTPLELAQLFYRTAVRPQH